MQDMVPLLDMQAPPEKINRQLITKVSIFILVMSLPVLYVSFLRVPPATLFRDTTFWFLMSNSIIVVIAADSGMLFFASSSSSAAYVVNDRPFVVVSGDASMAVVPDDELLPVVIVNDDDPCSQALVVARDHSDALVAVDGWSHPHALVMEGGEGGVDEPAARGEMVVSSSPSFALASGAGDADGARVQARLTASKSLQAREERARRRRRRSHSHHALVAVPPVQDKSVVVREEKLQRTATEGRHRPAAVAAAAEEEEESEYARLSDEELNRRVEDFITRFNREIRLQIEKEQA